MKKEISEDSVFIGGVEYTPKNSNQLASCDGLPYVLVRTYSAGVHVGYLKRRESTLAGIEVTLLRSRNIWYWKGAAGLSQLAMEGVKNPEECKFTMEVESRDLIAIEIIPVTESAQINIGKVAIWKK
jgi:hypothetical protein